jgi:putative restriction endonuclease
MTDVPDAQIYAHRFVRLRSDKNMRRWPASTRNRAPHKPLLLLAVMDMIASGSLSENFILLNPRLVDGFDRYWSSVMGAGPPGNPVLPFFHLRSEGFWHLQPVPGKGEILAYVDQIRSAQQLRDLVAGAELDVQLFLLLQQPELRDLLRDTLIHSCFAPELHHALRSNAQVEAEADRYQYRLRARVNDPFALNEERLESTGFLPDARSTAFRRMVVSAYDHTCAICGVRLLTAEGRTAVVAAHIIPWSVSRNDDPRNGLSLCGLHHWAFDQGLATVTEQCVVWISPDINTDDSRTEPLRNLNGLPIVQPSDATYNPSPQALTWHLRHVFRH